MKKKGIVVPYRKSETTSTISNKKNSTLRCRGLWTSSNRTGLSPGNTISVFSTFFRVWNWQAAVIQVALPFSFQYCHSVLIKAVLVRSAQIQKSAKKTISGSICCHNHFLWSTLPADVHFLKNELAAFSFLRSQNEVAYHSTFLHIWNRLQQIANHSQHREAGI